MKRHLVYLVFCLASLLSGAQPLDSIRVSMLTCSPGQEVYSLYGHTALRCENFTRDIDAVFNYGVFSFDQPNFIWRFVRGQCDYMVEPIPWKYFTREYEVRGSSVISQVLNLTQEEANRLYESLVENCRPENREYRYNFLYNNCTTMVRDMIERSVSGKVVYSDNVPKHTYRQILHQYTVNHPWAQEGDDFLLGADVDTLLSNRAEMFAPEYMMNYAEKAIIRQDNGDSRPLVLSTEKIIQERFVKVEPEFPLDPLLAVVTFLVVCILITFAEYFQNKCFWGWDVVLLFAQGLVGLLLLFMFFFSEHPAVGSNWLIWIFNPLAFVGIPMVASAAIKKRKTIWHPLYFVVLTLFIVFSPWIPQKFGILIVPLALCLLSRPVSYYLHYKKNKFE